jgi:hypothetical protein
VPTHSHSPLHRRSGQRIGHGAAHLSAPSSRGSSLAAEVHVGSHRGAHHHHTSTGGSASNQRGVVLVAGVVVAGGIHLAVVPLRGVDGVLGAVLAVLGQLVALSGGAGAVDRGVRVLLGPVELRGPNAGAGGAVLVECRLEADHLAVTGVSLVVEPVKE